MNYIKRGIDKQMKNQEIYILDLDGKYLIDKEYKTNKNTKYRGTLPYSMVAIKLDELYPTEIYLKGKKQYTKAIINVTFDKATYKDSDIDINLINKKTGKIKSTKKKGKPIYNTKQTREKLYTNGFVLDGVKYCFFMRSSSKARNGSVLFIKEKYYNDMISWARIGIEFAEGEEVSIASLRAYESLTLSSIENTVVINPDEILLIDDVEHSFISTASVTEFIGDNKLDTNTKKIEVTSKIWDGQSLADISLFPDKSKGMMQLRNRFFKTCAFATKIQKFFAKNRVTEVTDMFGNVMDASKIKLITTPSSLKLFKLAYKIGTKEETYKYWLDNLDTNFGLCKHEKASKYNNYNKLSYQMLNSMRLSEEKLRDLMQEELRYIDLLKNDLPVFKNHISNNEVSCSREFIFNLLAVNSKVKDTKLFKDFRRKQIQTYVDDLREGRIKIANTDYAILVSNPYEMLLSAIGKEITPTLHKGKEVYCSGYLDGESLVLMRNPHVCSGNILLSKNVFHQEFKDYFNFKGNKNIIIINTYDNDTFERLQGADTDGDMCLVTNNPIIKKKAEECVNYPTPIKRIASNQNKKRYYNIEDMVDVDCIISQNLIGDIINTSQIFNSYFWHIKNNPDEYDNCEKLLDLIYKCISQLSSLSQVELDKAKKFFDFKISTMLNDIKSTKYNDNLIIESDDIAIYKKSITEEEVEEINSLAEQIKNTKDKNEIKTLRNKIAEIKKVQKSKNVRPLFFKYCGEGKEYSFRHFDTSMDFVQDILNDLSSRNKTKNIDINEILVKGKLDEADRKQIKRIKEIISTLDKEIKLIYDDKNDDEKEKFRKKLQLKNEVIEQIAKMKISPITILDMLNRIFSKKSKDKEISKYKMLLMSVLWKAHEEAMMECFKELTDKDAEELQLDWNGTIELWGKKYNVVKSSTLKK